MKSLKSLLKKISKDIQSIPSKQLENEAKTNELTKAKDEKSQNSKKIHSHAYSSQVYDSIGEKSLRIKEYHQPSPRRARKERQENLKEVKVDLPHFYGKEDVETYLYWEMRVEQLFAYNHVSEEKKVPLATLSFQGDAMYWWNALQRERHLHKDPPIKNWNDLRGVLRCRHIPSLYNRKLMDKLQRLYQGNMSVEEYWQKMMSYIKRARINEDNHTTIDRFLSGLKLEIRNKVELFTL